MYIYRTNGFTLRNGTFQDKTFDGLPVDGIRQILNDYLTLRPTAGLKERLLLDG